MKVQHFQSVLGGHSRTGAASLQSLCLPQCLHQQIHTLHILLASAHAPFLICISLIGRLALRINSSLGALCCIVGSIMWTESTAPSTAVCCMQRFECRLNLELTWEEPLLNGVSNEDVDWSQIWKPTRVHFLNGHEVPHLQRVDSPQ